jgi:hypothetical protein
VLHPLDPELAEAASRLARERMISLQALLLGVWIATLRASFDDAAVVTGVVVNGRSEHLRDPLSAVGLFWNIVPLVSRAPLATLDQAEAAQRDLVLMEPFAGYPLPQILDDAGAPDLLRSSFRFLHFWNSAQPSEASGLRILDTFAFDRYSFPLNFVALLPAVARDGGFLILQYDPAVCSEDRAHAVLDRYEAELRAIALPALAG